MEKDYLVIDRSKWRTGGYKALTRTGEGLTKLLNEESFMCCLGFRCHQMGIPKEDLLNKTTPYFLTNWVIPDLVNENGCCSNFTAEAMSINDNMRIGAKEREKRLIAHFKTIGVTVIFKGRYIKNPGN